AEEAGAHHVGVAIYDMFNGERIGTSGGPLQLPQRPQRGHPSNDVTFNISSGQIPHAGEYEFRLSVDDQPAASVWLTVMATSSLN
ncbi:MAG: DUF6941 family protein, partial [Chloroflexota bacterium]